MQLRLGLPYSTESPALYEAGPCLGRLNAAITLVADAALVACNGVIWGLVRAQPEDAATSHLAAYHEQQLLLIRAVLLRSGDHKLEKAIQLQSTVWRYLTRFKALG